MDVSTSLEQALHHLQAIVARGKVQRRRLPPIYVATVDQVAVLEENGPHHLHLTASGGLEEPSLGVSLRRQSVVGNELADGLGGSERFSRVALGRRKKERK